MTFAHFSASPALLDVKPGFSLLDLLERVLFHVLFPAAIEWKGAALGGQLLRSLFPPRLLAVRWEIHISLHTPYLQSQRALPTAGPWPCPPCSPLLPTLLDRMDPSLPSQQLLSCLSVAGKGGLLKLLDSQHPTVHIQALLWPPHLDAFVSLQDTPCVPSSFGSLSICRHCPSWENIWLWCHLCIFPECKLFFTALSVLFFSETVVDV